MNFLEFFFDIFTSIIHFIFQSNDLTIAVFWVPVILGVIVVLIRMNLFKGI